MLQKPQEHVFLEGGGEMGSLMRSKDWSSSPLGSPDTWPPVLQTAVSILLHSQFPMFIWWGPEMIMFYNDAYLPIAGSKHPHALGNKGNEIWSEVWSEIAPLVNDVITNKQSSLAKDQPLLINRHGYMEEAYFTFSHSPLFNASGDADGVLCIVTETTEKVVATKKIKEREQNFRELVLQAPVAICVVTGADYIVEMVNEGMLNFLGRTPEIIGKPILGALPEAKLQGLIHILDTVRESGKPYSVSTFPATLLIDGIRETRYFNLVFKPYFQNGQQKEVTSIFCVAHNVTEEVLIRKKLEENEFDLQNKVAERTKDLQQQKIFISSILDASFSGIYALQAVRDKEGSIIDFQYLFANNNIAKLLKLSVEQLIGTPMLALLPENKNNGFFDLFCKAVQTGEAIHDVTHFVTNTINNWYDFIIIPIDKETVVVTIQDISEQKRAAFEIEQQRNLLDNIMAHSPTGITVTEMIRNEAGDIIDGKVIMANNASESYVGISIDQLLGKNISQNDPMILESPLFQLALETLSTGKPFNTQYFIESTRRWLELSVAKMDENRLINVFTEITATKTAQLEIVQSAERLQAVFNAAQSGMFIFSPVYDNKEIIDFHFVLTNPTFAAYVGQPPEALKDTLGSTWFPGYLVNGVFEMYKATFVTGKPHRKDIHYHVDGHDLYLDLMSTKVGNELLVVFTDYTELKKAQFQLEKHIEELKRSNANLEEFAHAASHDLKEPVRKVQVFSDRLKKSFDNLTIEQEFLFSRVQDATKRMSLLIDDLLDYSHVSMGINLLEKIDLNKKVEIVLNDLEMAIQEKGAIITVGKLPSIIGHRRQLQQLFHNLIQNALKYSKGNEPPRITITSEKVIGSTSNFNISTEESDRWYYLIQIKDNGIGFHQEHAERIFQMFQRLHGRSEYSGSGVGLAIVRKVVENHNGRIMAESRPGEGATFKILLPADQ